jgi:Na+-translocating ferredoxin:NAD+ oxidoreductase RnfC subunit
MSLSNKVRDAGVVGAGGAGFPAHVKLGGGNVEWFLANGAECEPLMHKDREIMVHFADEILEGLHLAADSVGATKSGIGIKSKNKTAVDAIQSRIAGNGVVMELFGDFYPAGDEYELVYKMTGKLIPPQGLPLDIGAVVNNVETLYNIQQAGKGIPVTEKFLTIAGKVKEPVTLWVPIGMPVSEVLELAGGPSIAEYAVMESGIMMGEVIQDLNQPVTKTTGGLIVLPADHEVINRYTKPQKAMDRIGMAACDQCTYCTELCPRYLLGYDIQPHRVMRSLWFAGPKRDIHNKFALLCCRCGICTLYACPEALYPREACERSIEEMQAIGRGKYENHHEVKVHPTKDARKLPLKQLMNRLGVADYDAPALFEERSISPALVTIPLQQHVGVPASPLVSKGDPVNSGQMIADVPDGELGAPVHASIQGKVREVTDTTIVIERN